MKISCVTNLGLLVLGELYVGSFLCTGTPVVPDKSIQNVNHYKICKFMGKIRNVWRLLLIILVSQR